MSLKINIQIKSIRKMALFPSSVSRSYRRKTCPNQTQFAYLSFKETKNVFDVKFQELKVFRY